MGYHFPNILTDPTIQGTVKAGTGLTMPAFTLGGTLNANNQIISTCQYMTGTLNRGIMRPYNNTTGAMQLIPEVSYPLEITRPKLMTQMDCNGKVLKALRTLIAAPALADLAVGEIAIGGIGAAATEGRIWIKRNATEIHQFNSAAVITA